MKRFPFIAAIFILVISIFIFFMQSGGVEKSAADVIQAAIAAVGARVVTSDIYIRGMLGTDDCDSLQERQLLLTDLIRNAGADTDKVRPAFNEINTDTGSGTQLDYIINNDSSVHASILTEKKGGSIGISWAAISLINTSNSQELSETAASMEKFFKKYSKSISVNLCMTGSIDGMLDKDKKDAICRELLESAGARKVEGLQEGELTSVSAFSPSIGNSIRVNGKRINLNAAVRYNSYERKTYIWLASPVIMTEY